MNGGLEATDSSLLEYVAGEEEQRGEDEYWRVAQSVLFRGFINEVVCLGRAYLCRRKWS